VELPNYTSLKKRSPPRFGALRHCFDTYLRTETPWSMTPYMVMPLDPLADDDPPEAPAQPAHAATSSVAIKILIMRIPAQPSFNAKHHSSAGLARRS
jgi:hypothetical protein